MNEFERLGELIVPYLCERTGLSRAQVETFLDAQNEFWEGQLARMGFVIEDEEDDAG